MAVMQIVWDVELANSPDGTVFRTETVIARDAMSAAEKGVKLGISASRKEGRTTVAKHVINVRRVKVITG